MFKLINLSLSKYKLNVGKKPRTKLAINDLLISVLPLLTINVLYETNVVHPL